MKNLSIFVEKGLCIEDIIKLPEMSMTILGWAKRQINKEN
jgi:hypothetical protein